MVRVPSVWGRSSRTTIEIVEERRIAAVKDDGVGTPLAIIDTSSTIASGVLTSVGDG